MGWAWTAIQTLVPKNTIFHENWPEREVVSSEWGSFTGDSKQWIARDGAMREPCSRGVVNRGRMREPQTSTTPEANDVGSPTTAQWREQ